MKNLTRLFILLIVLLTLQACSGKEEKKKEEYPVQGKYFAYWKDDETNLWKYELEFKGDKVKYTRYNQVKTPLVKLKGFTNFKDKTIEFEEKNANGLTFRINGDIITTKDSVGDTLKYYKEGSKEQKKNEKEFENHAQLVS